MATPNLTRKFVDLIYGLSSKYPTVDPAVHDVAVGDYGNLDRQTGTWIRDGNIFDGGFGQGVQVLESDIDSSFSTHTSNVAETDVEIAATGDLANVAGANVGVRYEFLHEGGAFVLVRELRCRYLHTSRISALLEDPRLHGRVLVDRVWTAPAYIYYMTLQAGSSVTISGSVHTPIAALAGLNVGGAVTFAWNNRHQGGVYREGRAPGATYTPLFSIVRKKGFFRDLPQTGVPDYEEAGPPWHDLDEEGEEIMPVEH